MRAVREQPEYYELFSTRPLPIRPFDPESKRAALAYGCTGSYIRSVPGWR